MNHFVALFPTLSCSSPYFSTYTAAPGPPTCTGATGGGRTSPVSSEWDMMRAPISLVLTPQDVAHTSSRSGHIEAGRGDTGHGTPTKYNHSRFAAKRSQTDSIHNNNSHLTLPKHYIQSKSRGCNVPHQDLVHFLYISFSLPFSPPCFDVLLTFLLSLIVHIECSSEILTYTPHGTDKQSIP